MIRVMLVDDQMIVREGLKSMLSLEPDITVVAEASNGEQALQKLPSCQPNIVLLDIRMPEMDGLTALEKIKQLSPQTSVLMVTLYDDPDYLYKAIVLGATGYVLKDTGREEFVRAIRITDEGGAVVAPGLLKELLKRLEHLGAIPADPATVQTNLSDRELEVLALVAEGLTNAEIAEALYISTTTVKTHVKNIIQKLDVSDRTQAAVHAVRAGLI